MEVIFEEITDWNPEHSRGRSESKNQIENGKINNDLSDRQSRAVTLAADTGGLIYHFAQFNDLGLRIGVESRKYFPNHLSRDPKLPGDHS
jgi:hypothetical protein